MFARALLPTACRQSIRKDPNCYLRASVANGRKACFTADNRDARMDGTIPIMGKGVAVGQYAKVERCFTAAQVDTFGSLVQDNNFLHSSIDWHDDFELMRESVPVSKAHVDAGLLRKSEENGCSRTRPLVHGMLVSSIFSSIFASLVPGSIYINQTLQFATPIFAGDTIVGRVEIEKIRKWRKGGVVVQCVTQVFSKVERIPLIKGVANVWLPEGNEER